MRTSSGATTTGYANGILRKCERGTVMDEMKKRLANLLTVKSIVTVVLTGVFAALALRGVVSGTEFLTVFTLVVSFYFGTQAKKE